MLLSSERRVLQKHFLIIVGLWSFCSLEMNILAWAFCPFCLWRDMSSPQGYLWSRNWQNLSNLTCVTSERSRPQWEEQLWGHLHSLASSGTKAQPPTRAFTAWFPCFCSFPPKWQVDYEKKVSFSLQYPMSGIPSQAVMWTGLCRMERRKSFWTWLGSALPFNRLVP